MFLSEDSCRIMNGEVTRCVDREMEDKRLILGQLGEKHRAERP